MMPDRTTSDHFYEEGKDGGGARSRFTENKKFLSQLTEKNISRITKYFSHELTKLMRY
jgi:hypothetical protein